MEKVTFEQFRTMMKEADMFAGAQHIWARGQAGGAPRDSRWHGDDPHPSADLAHNKVYQSLTPELQEMVKDGITDTQWYKANNNFSPEIEGLHAVRDQYRDVEHEFKALFMREQGGFNSELFQQYPDLVALHDEGFDWRNKETSEAVQDAFDYRMYQAFCKEHGIAPDSHEFTGKVNQLAVKGGQICDKMRDAISKYRAEVKAAVAKKDEDEKKAEPVKGITKISNAKDEKAADGKASEGKTEEASWGGLRESGLAFKPENVGNTLKNLSAQDMQALISALKEQGQI